MAYEERPVIPRLPPSPAEIYDGVRDVPQEAAALDPGEARNILEQGGIDLAIVDLRLLNDGDEKDISGLTLARETARSVPKIILTRFATVEAVREALGPQLEGLPPAVLTSV